MRLAFAILTLVVFFVQPVSAEQASLQDRLLLSQTVANYINDPDYKGYKHFGGARAVEIGAAVVEGNGAIANWRSIDGKHYGQVAFYHRCDSWNVLTVSNKVPLQPRQVIMPGLITKRAAIMLIAQLGALETKRVAYLKPPRAQVSC